MRGILYLGGTALGSLAFQVSVALWPQKFAQYAWLVKYVWMAWFVFLLSWLITHERVLGRRLRKFWGVEDGPKQHMEPSPPPLSAPAGPTQNQAANPHMEQRVNVHLGGLLEEATAAASKLQTSSPPKELEPNIRCLGSNSLKLLLGMNGLGFYDSGGRCESALICFKNETLIDKKVSEPRYVRASLTFYDKGGNQLGLGIGEACWFGNFRDIHFTLEEAQCVVALMVSDNGRLACPGIQRRPSHYGRFAPQSFSN